MDALSTKNDDVRRRAILRLCALLVDVSTCEGLKKGPPMHVLDMLTLMLRRDDAGEPVLRVPQGRSVVFSLADKAATVGKIDKDTLSGTHSEVASACMYDGNTHHSAHVKHFGGQAMPTTGYRKPELKPLRELAPRAKPTRWSGRLAMQDNAGAQMTARVIEEAKAVSAAKRKAKFQVPLPDSISAPLSTAHRLAHAVALLVSSAGKCSRSAGTMASTYAFAEGWMGRVDRKFHFKEEDELSNADCVSGLVHNVNLVERMVKKKGFSSVAQFYGVFVLSLGLRFASIPSEVYAHLNLWPSHDSNEMIARSLGRAVPSVKGRCWSTGLLMLMLAVKRSGWSTANGLLEKSGYDGLALRRGLLCTVFRLVLWPRKGQEPLFFIVATNPNIGMNWGSCHAPSPAVPQSPDGQPPTQAWLDILAEARELLLRLHYKGDRPHGPVCQEDDPRLKPLQAIKLHERPEYDRWPKHDKDIVQKCEETCGCELFSIADLDAPFRPFPALYM